MKISIYTSLFNVDNGMFDIFNALKNWNKYADEIIVGTIPCQKDRVKEILYDNNPVRGVPIRISSMDTTLEDPLFDGKLKEGALRGCKNKIVIQQDLDERIGGEIYQWEGLFSFLSRNDDFKAFMLPVIDLYKDLDHYKGLGAKWYLHHKDGCHRGPVAFAKRGDGTIDTEKSDTCELIDEQGNLASFLRDDRFTLSTVMDRFNIIMPHIIHLGYLDLDKRVENNKFWGPVWTARNGKTVKVATTVSSVEEENQAIPHGIKREWWK